MICNAGFGVYGAIDQIVPAEQMQRLLDVNYLGTYHADPRGAAALPAPGTGHIIVVSSIVGRRGVPLHGRLLGHKVRQVGLAECLRAELRGPGIHVTRLSRSRPKPSSSR